MKATYCKNGLKPGGRQTEKRRRTGCRKIFQKLVKSACRLQTVSRSEHIKSTLEFKTINSRPYQTAILTCRQTVSWSREYRFKANYVWIPIIIQMIGWRGQSDYLISKKPAAHYLRSVKNVARTTHWDETLIRYLKSGPNECFLIAFELGLNRHTDLWIS